MWVRLGLARWAIGMALLLGQLGAQAAMQVAGGFGYTLALAEDGSVYSWGSNTFGNLGHGDLIDRKFPTKINGLTGVVAVSTRGSTSYALKADGTIWAWGSNSSGQVGDNTTINRITPTLLAGGHSTFKAVAAGSAFALALKTDGTVWAWGANTQGQLGQVTANSAVAAPLQVPGLAGITAIAAGAAFGIANSAATAQVYQWGLVATALNAPLTSNKLPTTVSVANASPNVGLANGPLAAANATGYAYSLLAAWAWGAGSNGEMGDGTNTGVMPTAVGAVFAASGPSPAMPSVAGGGAAHAFQLSFSSSAGGVALFTWGSNNRGQLGLGSTTDTNKRTAIPNFADVVHAAAGLDHMVAVKSDGSVWIWGAATGAAAGDIVGQTQRSSPARVLGANGEGFLSLKQAPAATVTQCAIEGPDAVTEGASASFLIKGTLSNGSPVESTTNANWLVCQDGAFLGCTAAGASTAASVTSAGIFTAGQVAANTKVLLFGTCKAPGGATMGTIKAVTIVNTATLTGCAITGPETVTEGTSANYLITGTLSDGSSRDYSSSTSWLVCPSGAILGCLAADASPAATIAAGGRLTGANVSADTPVVLTGTCGPVDGRSVSATKRITILNSVVVNNSASERILRFFEATFPTYLAPSGASTVSDLEYAYRFYPATQSYLIIGLATPFAGRILYFGPASGGKILDLGSQIEWLATATLAGF